jgi:hypothetical protein
MTPFDITPMLKLVPIATYFPTRAGSPTLNVGGVRVDSDVGPVARSAQAVTSVRQNSGTVRVIIVSSFGRSRPPRR